VDIIFILFLLQVVTESLPISSSSHVFIVRSVCLFGARSFLLETLEDLSYGLTMMSVMVLFWRDWSGLLRHLFSFRLGRDSYRRLLKFFFVISLYVVVIDVMTAIAFFTFRHLLKGSWLMTSPVVVLIGCSVTMCLLLSLRMVPRSYDRLTFKKAVLIGLVQASAVLPGISRFGSTYVAGSWLGLAPRRAMQFSFLIYFPLMAATFVKGLFHIDAQVISLFCSLQNWFFVILATVGGYVALRFVYRLGQAGKFWRFGIYMIVPCFLLLWVVIRGRM
jgi:undecaprenyl-diphosphatase